MRATSLLAASLLVAALVAPAEADQRQVALGAEGELYEVMAGTYGELFALSSGNDPDAPVLALDVRAAGSLNQRLLVPGTEGPEEEESPAIVHGESSTGVLLIWESRSGYYHSQIKLVGYDQGRWTEPILLPGEIFSQKTSPTLTVTRDRFVTVGAQGSIQTQTRTIYHVIWWEEAAAGERVVYSPVVLIDGTYIGWSPLFVLNELELGAARPVSFTPSQELLRAPSIQPGRNGETVVVGFVDLATGQLAQLEISVLASELASLAQSLRTELLGSGLDPQDPAQAAALVDRARAHLIDFGAFMRLHPGFINYLSSLSGEVIRSNLGEPLQDLANRARAHLIDFGARMAAQGLSQAPTESRTWMLEFPNESPYTATDDTPLHWLQGRLGAARPIPETGAGPTTLYLSRNAKQAIVVWQEGDRLYYRESQGPGWSEAQYLQLTGDLDLNQAHSILEKRARNR